MSGLKYVSLKYVRSEKCQSKICSPKKCQGTVLAQIYVRVDRDICAQNLWHKCVDHKSEICCCSRIGALKICPKMKKSELPISFHFSWQSVWPYCTKFRHLGKILQVFGKFLTVDFLFGKMFNILWVKLLHFWANFHCCEWPSI